MAGRISDSKLRDLILREIEDYVDEQDRKVGGIWTPYYDEMSSRKWNNRMVQDAVDLLMDNWDDIFDQVAGRDDDDEDVVEHYVPRFINGHMAATIVNSKIADELSRRDFEDLQDVADKWLRSFGDNRRRGRDRNSRDTGYRREREERGGRRGERERGRRDRDERHRQNSARERDRQVDDRVARTSAWGAVGAAGEEEEDRQDRARRERNREERRDSEPVRAPNPQVELTLQMSRPSGPDFTSARPYDDYIQGNKHFQVASTSDWVLDTGTSAEDPGVPLPASFYDAREVVRFLVKDLTDNTISEEFVRMSQDLRYIQHQQLWNGPEGDSSSRQHIVPRNRNTSEGETQVEEAKVEVTRVKLGDVLTSLAEVKLDENNERLVDTEQTLVTHARAQMHASKAKVHIEAGLVRKLVHIKGDFDKQDAIVQAFGDASNLAEASRILAENEHILEPAVYEELNDYITERLNIALRYQFQYGAIKRFNFARAWVKDVVPHLTETLGADLVKTLNQRCMHVPALCATRAAKEHYADWIGDLYDTPEKLESFNGFVFLRRQMVGVVDYTADDIGVGKILECQYPNTASDLGFGSVSSTDGSQVNTALRKLYSQLPDMTERERQLAEVHIYTQDDKRICTVPYSARVANFILFNRHQ